METTTVFPFLLEVFNNLNSPDDKEKLHHIISHIESFLIRRLVCKLTTKNYNKLFLSLIKTIEKENGYTPEAVAGFLMKSDSETDRWPDDEEFKEAWMKSKFYFSMSRARGRMILEAVNDHLIDDKTESVKAPEKLTIEHIMPQSWQKYWSLSPVLTPEQRIEAENYRDVMIHTVGNLTLITKQLNPSISNGNWVTKKDALLKHSVINLNRKLLGYNEWNENKIEQRGLQLFDIALKLWSRE